MKIGFRTFLTLGFMLILAACTRATIMGTPAEFSSSAIVYTFPTTSVGMPSTLTVTIQNYGQTEGTSIRSNFQGSVFSIAGVSWPGTGGTCGPTIPANSSCTVVLQFLPVVGGVVNGSVTISFFDGEEVSNWTAVLSGTAMAGGSLDTTFGSSGISQYDFGHDEQINSLNLQVDGRLVLFGNTDNNSGNQDVMAARLNTWGALDTTFGTGGIQTMNTGSNDYGYASTLVSNSGMLLGVGSAGNHAMLVACNAAGAMESSFGIMGISVLSPIIIGSTDASYGIANLNDGRAVISGTVNPLIGTPEMFVARIATNGFLDLSFPLFGVAGVVTVPNFGFLSTDKAYAVAVQSGGQVIAAGSSLTGGYLHSAMVRLNSDGSLDGTFGAAGKVLVDMCGTGRDNEILDITIDQSGMILVAGYCKNAGNVKDVFVARYSPVGGTLDPTFGVAGVKKMDIAGNDDVFYKVLTLSNGKIVASGYSNNGSVDQFLLVELNADGSPNLSFGASGIVTTTLVGNSRAKAMVIQSDNKIVLAGYSTSTTTNVAAVRYYP